MNQVLTKKCSKCQEVKPISEFYKNIGRKDGHCKTCKVCNKHYYQTNKKILCEKSKKTYIKNSLKFLEYINKHDDNYYLTHNITIKKCGNCQEMKPIKQFYKHRRNEDGFTCFCKSCIHAHQRKTNMQINTNRRVRNSIRRKTDINYRLDLNFCCNVANALYRKCKSTSSHELLGCTIEEYKIYLTNLFKDGMTWKNWGKGKGKWQIDHKIPKNFFQTDNYTEQKQCFHYTNTQPMWYKDNLEKGDKIILEHANFNLPVIRDIN